MKSEVRKGKNIYCYFAALLTVGILTIFDQFTKYLAVNHLKGNLPVELIKNVLEFRYLENKGMAFGLLSGKISLFLMCCVVFLCLAVYFFIKIPKNRFYFPVILAGMILTAGAIGNFIDRLWHGYVIDFIYFKLINFPIFNVADIYVVVSCFLLILLIMFRYEDDDFKFLVPKYKDK